MLKRALFGGSPFDYYVDSNRGSDTFSGKTPGQPFVSFAKLAAVLRPGMVVGLACASLFRSTLVVPCPGVTFIAYGAGPKPQISNSVPFASGAWTAVTGTEYKLASGATVGPAPGGTTPAIFWIDAAGTVTALYKGTAGALSANQWAISGGFLSVNIGRAPLATDRFEVGQGYGVQIEYSRTRVSGVFAAFNGGYNIAVNTVSAVDDVQIDNCELAYTSADNCNINSGTGTNIRFAFNVSRDAVSDGSGGGDLFSAHGACSGKILFNTFLRAGKGGISNSEKGTWDYFGNTFDGAFLIAYLDGGGAGVHRAIGNTFVNQVPNLDAGAPRLYFAGTMAAGSTIFNNSIAKGTGSGNERGIRIDGGTVDRRNNGIYGTGTDLATKFSIGLYVAAGTVTESNDGVGGCTTNRLGGTSTNPITVNADPFTSVATGNLRPAVGSPLLAAGIAIPGFTTGSPPDVGYTGVSL